jgi:hypothetical protein
MASALKCAHPHNYRLSTYERKANDFYPTPSDLTTGLAVGLSRLGFDLPIMALDPCGGDGALRRGLAPFGIDMRLSDLYPEKYPGDGYVSRESLNACDPEHLRSSLEQAGLACRAIITNTPHNTFEACAIVSNLIALVEGQRLDLVAALFRSIWGSEPGRLAYLNRASFCGEVACCWRCRWIEGSTGSPMHAYSWYIWRKTPRYGPSLKVRIGQREAVSAPSAMNSQTRG